jgi:peptidoglycan/LPS O-acetylase OafA/YrhL
MQARRILIDALKLIGSQLIVLHHLSAYGPVADAVSQVFPGLMAWFYDEARMAVQIFLVLGGYLAIASLEPSARERTGSLLRTLLRRYQRLILPFLVALLLAAASAALARQWMNSDFIPAAPTWGQALAHALMLQGVLDFDSLSAGVWYVAMDFQLFVLLALLLHAGYRVRRVPKLAPVMVLALMLASLFYFNRDQRWDNWAPYFFGAYGMGVVARWVGRSRRPGLLLALLPLLGVAALWLDFRQRIALALATALLLGISQWRHARGHPLPSVPPRLAKPVHALGQASYALFLIHFPVLTLGNALFVKLGLSGPLAGTSMLLACWATSVGLALLFERWVEAPLSRWGYPRKSGSTSAAASRPVQSTSPRTR